MERRSRRLGRSGLEARRRAELAVGDRHRLEQGAHFALTLADQARPRALEFLRPFGARAVGERLGPQVDADRAQEIALVYRAIDGGARGACAPGPRGEVDVGSEVPIAARR